MTVIGLVKHRDDASGWWRVYFVYDYEDAPPLPVGEFRDEWIADVFVDAIRRPDWVRVKHACDTLVPLLTKDPG
jgi:hypothetical protein